MERREAIIVIFERFGATHSNWVTVKKLEERALLIGLTLHIGTAVILGISSKSFWMFATVMLPLMPVYCACLDAWSEVSHRFSDSPSSIAVPVTYLAIVFGLIVLFFWYCFQEFGESLRRSYRRDLFGRDHTWEFDDQELCEGNFDLRIRVRRIEPATEPVEREIEP